MNGHILGGLGIGSECFRQGQSTTIKIGNNVKYYRKIICVIQNDFLTNTIAFLRGKTGFVEKSYCFEHYN